MSQNAATAGSPWYTHPQPPDTSLRLDRLAPDDRRFYRPCCPEPQRETVMLRHSRTRLRRRLAPQTLFANDLDCRDYAGRSDRLQFFFSKMDMIRGSFEADSATSCAKSSTEDSMRANGVLHMCVSKH